MYYQCVGGIALYAAAKVEFTHIVDADNVVVVEAEEEVVALGICRECTVGKTNLPHFKFFGEKRCVGASAKIVDRDVQSLQIIGLIGKPGGVNG